MSTGNIAQLSLLVIATLVGWLFWSGAFTARIVLSGSMEPSISTGAIVITRPQAEYQVGDVITFESAGQNQIPTTHRITEVKADALGAIYTTRGDANDSADFVPVRQDRVLGRVLLDVPYLGYILDFAKKPLGFGLMVGLPLVLIIIGELNKIVAEIRRMKNPTPDKV